MSSFEGAVTELFNQRFHTVFRYLDRLTGDPDMAQDLAQEAFVRLYQRGEMPDDPAAWLVTVATNLFRDARRTEIRRESLLEEHAAVTLYSDDTVPVDERLVTEEERARVRSALDTLSLRDRQMLLLRHEGYSYKEVARIVGIAESSVGTLLIRATQTFRMALEKSSHASDTTLD